MVALLTSDPIYRIPEADMYARRSRPRHLHAVPTPTPSAKAPGADAGALPNRQSLVELAGLAAVVVLALVVVGMFRSAQAPPIPAQWSDVAPIAAPMAVDEIIVAVQPGDTLWAIAGSLAPQMDRREAVQRLADRNGGSAIWAGQELIVPAALVNL